MILASPPTSMFDKVERHKKEQKKTYMHMRRTYGKSLKLGIKPGSSPSQLYVKSMAERVLYYFPNSAESDCYFAGLSKYFIKAI